MSLWSTHFKGAKKGVNLDLVNPHTTRCSLKHPWSNEVIPYSYGCHFGWLCYWKGYDSNTRVPQVGIMVHTSKGSWEMGNVGHWIFLWDKKSIVKHPWSNGIPACPYSCHFCLSFSFKGNGNCGGTWGGILVHIPHGSSGRGTPGPYYYSIGYWTYSEISLEQWCPAFFLLLSFWLILELKIQLQHWGSYGCYYGCHCGPHISEKFRKGQRWVFNISIGCQK